VPSLSGPVGSVQVWGYSTDTKQYTMAVQNTDSLRAFTSAGWTGASITWESSYSTLPSFLSDQRLVYTKVSDSRFTWRERQLFKNGRVIDHPETQCDRK